MKISAINREMTTLGLDIMTLARATKAEKDNKKKKELAIRLGIACSEYDTVNQIYDELWMSVEEILKLVE